MIRQLESTQRRQELKTAFLLRVAVSKLKHLRVKNRNNMLGLYKEIQNLQEELARISDAQILLTEWKASDQAKPIESVPRESQKLSITDNGIYLDDVHFSRLYIEGQTAMAEKNFTRAKRIFKEFLNITPPVWEAHFYFLKAAYYENPGKAAYDSSFLQLLAGLPPSLDEKGRVSKLWGFISLEKGDYAEGMAYLKRARSFLPDDREIDLKLGTAAFAFGDYKICIEFLENAAPLEATDSFLLGKAYEALGKIDSAYTQYQVCRAIDPEYYPVYKQIGYINKNKTAYKEACEAFEQFHRYRKDVDSLIALGECYAGLEHSSKAVKAWQVVLNRFPGTVEAEKANYLIERIQK